VPGIAFPVGFDDEGLPVGMQLNAPHLGEAALLQAAHAFQSVTSWHKERPDL
jgi:aspartyl-tRNA(Asn)/glutamyl-tRNA(Gln) amidotransferase subunit A